MLQYLIFKATSLTPLIEVLAVSKQAEAANATAPPPYLIVPQEFNFEGSIASSSAIQQVKLDNSCPAE